MTRPAVSDGIVDPRNTQPLPAQQARSLNMGERLLVYGAIEEPWGGHPNSEFLWEVNREAIASLPSEREILAAPPEGWQWIVREMFQPPMPVVSPTWAMRRSVHQVYGPVISFAASCKCYDQISAWIGEFEALLRKMYWLSAFAHFRTEYTGYEDCEYGWAPKSDWLHATAESVPPPVNSWERKRTPLRSNEEESHDPPLH